MAYEGRKPTKGEQKEISKGVEKMVHEYERKGEIETSRGATYKPESKDKAIRQALAIEYGKHKAGRAGKKKGQ